MDNIHRFTKGFRLQEYQAGQHGACRSRRRDLGLQFFCQVGQGQSCRLDWFCLWIKIRPEKSPTFKVCFPISSTEERLMVDGETCGNLVLQPYSANYKGLGKIFWIVIISNLTDFLMIRFSSLAPFLFFVCLFSIYPSLSIFFIFHCLFIFLYFSRPFKTVNF